MKKEIILTIVNALAKAHILTPLNVAKLRYMYIMHKIPNFKNPKDLNEKINWMKFYGDTSKWAQLSDKYAVREYIENIGLGNTLVKLYGKWDKVEDIEWDKLPNQFVMKVNNGSGDVKVVRDKSQLDIEATRAYFAKMLQRPFGRTSGELHYANIKPCIIAEELLDTTTQPCHSSSLIDYKIWCVNGKPYYTWACSNREQYFASVGLYDMDWNYHPEYSVFTHHYREAKELVPKPSCFAEMMETASKLSEGFPVVRVDLYEVNGKVYFGEMTFTSQGGYMDFYTSDFLKMIGDKIDLNCNTK